MCLRSLLNAVWRTAATLLLLTGGTAVRSMAMSAPGSILSPDPSNNCLSAPPNFVPFSSVYYTTAPNTNGDRLVVGKMSLTLLSLLEQATLPGTANQQLCDPLQIAPGLYVQAYVPTAAERQGDYSAFGEPVLDPYTHFPFAGNIIPASRLGDPIAWRIRGLLAGPPATAPAPLQFVPVTPCRVADSRNFTNGALRAQTTTDFLIWNSGCGIPPYAQAYSLNFTVVPAAKLTYLTVFPTGQSRPLVSTLNSYDGRIKANAAIIPAGTNGAVSVFSTDSTQLIIDIDGYFVPASTHTALAFYPVTPCRLVDTREAAGPLGGPVLSAGQERIFPVQTSGCGVPPTAKAYALNYTAVPNGPLDYLTTWPAGQTRPLVSTLNAPTGTITANGAIVPAGNNGDLSVFVTEETDLIVDISGYFAAPTSGGLSLYNLTPCRIFDSRTQAGATPLANTTQIDAEGSGCSVPATAQSYVLNTTVVPAGPLLFVTLWPHGATDQPTVSTLNALDGEVTSNLAIVPTTDGTFNAFALSPTHLIFDIAGYFAP